MTRSTTLTLSPSDHSAADVAPFGAAGLAEPVLRADPRYRIEVPPASQAPVLLTAVAALCLVAALAGQRMWSSGRELAAAGPQTSSRVALPAPAVASHAAVQAAAVTPATQPLPPPVASAPARHLAQRDARAGVRHAAARVRAGRAARLHAGRRNGEGRA
jgi:hypothetical protein